MSPAETAYGPQIDDFRVNAVLEHPSGVWRTVLPVAPGIAGLQRMTRPRHSRMSPGEILERRSNRLARALRRLGVSTGATVHLLLDDPEGIDGQVALVAARKIGAEISMRLVPSEEGKAIAVARMLPVKTLDVIIASEAGVRALQAANVCGVILGDGPGVRWWRAAEARESAEPLEGVS